MSRRDSGRRPWPPRPSISESRTEPGDSVLIWGTEAGINFMSGRPSPTRYVYQLPLYTRGYTESDHVAEFLGDLQRNPPELIVDVSAQDPRFPPIDPETRASWTPTLDSFGAAYVPLPDMDAVLDYLNEHYRPVKVPSAEEATDTNQRVRQLLRQAHDYGYVVYKRLKSEGRRPPLHADAMLHATASPTPSQYQ